MWLLKSIIHRKACEILREVEQELINKSTQEDKLKSLSNDIKERFEHATISVTYVHAAGVVIKKMAELMKTNVNISALTVPSPLSESVIAV